MRYFILSLIILAWSAAHAQQLARNGAGARSAAMGGSTAHLKDSWSAINNVAGMAEVDQHTIHASYENRYGMAAFSTAAFGATLPIKYGAIGLNVMQFGGQLFSESALSLGYAHRISNINLGMRANLMQYRFDGLDAKQVPTFDMGVQNQLTDDLHIGAYVTNIFRAKLYDFEDERAPSVIKIALAYQPTDKLIVVLEGDKDIDYDPIMRGGIEYKPVDQLRVRTGFVTGEGFSGTFGLGLEHKGGIIDYSLNTHPNLGLVHQVSLGWRFGQKKAPSEEQTDGK